MSGYECVCVFCVLFCVTDLLSPYQFRAGSQHRQSALASASAFRHLSFLSLSRWLRQQRFVVVFEVGSSQRFSFRSVPANTLPDSKKFASTTGTNAARLCSEEHAHLTSAASSRTIIFIWAIKKVIINYGLREAQYTRRCPFPAN